MCCFCVCDVSSGWPVLWVFVLVWCCGYVLSRTCVLLTTEMKTVAATSVAAMSTRVVLDRVVCAWCERVPHCGCLVVVVLCLLCKMERGVFVFEDSGVLSGWKILCVDRKLSIFETLVIF